MFRLFFRFSCLFLPFCLSFISIQAQTPDTLRSHTLPEVTVAESALRSYTAGSRIMRVDSTLLQAFNTAALSEVLQTQMSIYFRNYGAGQLNSITFRGTSANHTNVLWNGFSVNSPTLGSSDFSVLPAFGYNQVEIQHGNAASLWGSGSIGGSVLIGSQPVFGRGWQVAAQTETSRFGTGDFSLNPLRINYLSNQARLRHSNVNLHFSTNLWQNQAENNFPYRNIVVFGSPEVRQQNAAFRQWGLTQDVDWRFAKNGLVSAKVWYTHTYRQAQPSMLEANQGNYRIDDALRVLLSGQYATRWGETTLKTAFFRESLDWNGADSPVYSWQTQLLHEKSFSPKLSAKAGAELQLFEANIAGNYNRRETRQSVFLLSDYRPWEWLTLTANLRQAWVTGFDPPLAPTLGTNITLYKTGNQEITVKGNLSRSYRVPTLHDRFWLNDGGAGGNPDIRPEASWGYESGLVHRLAAGRWQISSEATYYRNTVRDWIQWTPVGGFWSPRNIVTVRTQGLELSNQVTYRRNSTRISFKTQYFLNRAVSTASESPEKIGRQLEFTPLHTFMAALQVSHRRWFGWANYQFFSERLDFDLFAAPMEPYGLVNAVIGRTMPLPKKQQMQVIFKCNNLFNTEYRTYGLYAMPGRNYNLSIRYQFNP
ncbi:MAG: TonB-dependent receptor plug domain-containing protein [Cytophagales bacterium]|nr:TonB-dependent receptor plug domain-containing protein [Cytophagales bacterium]